VRNVPDTAGVLADVLVLRPFLSIFIRSIGPGRLRLAAVRFGHGL
jgi:hypothetical protein